MKAIGYLQIQAERNHVGGLRGASVARVTKRPPSDPMGDSIVVRVELDIPEGAFEPYIARGEVPEGVKAVPITIEEHPHD